MSGRHGPAIALLALCAAAVVALAVGVHLYGSLLPPEAAARPPATGVVAVVTGGALVVLAAAVLWLLLRRRRSAEPELDRRLWEALGRPGGDARRQNGE